MDATEAEKQCPVCGYDCRGLDRCPECGLDAAGFASRRRNLAWPQRRELGTWTAFWRTVWDVLLRPWRLADAATAPVADRDGRTFAWICVGISAPLLALVAAGAVVAASAVPGVRGTIIGLSDRFETARLIFRSSWSVDWELPGRMGFSLLTAGLAVLMMAVMCPWSLTTPFALVRRERHVTERALRCAALSRYLAAGQLLLAPAAGAVAAAMDSNSNYRGVMELSGRSVELTFAVVMATWSFGVLTLGPLALLWRAGAQWWQAGLGVIVWLVQWALIAALSVAVCIGLPGLARCYLEIVK